MRRPIALGPSARCSALDKPFGATYNAARSPRRQGAPGAQVAQLVEHATENRSVGGSIPPLGTIKIKYLPRKPNAAGTSRSSGTIIWATNSGFHFPTIHAAMNTSAAAAKAK
jgi:hypothetical protein